MERLTARSAGFPILDPRHEGKYTHLELIDLLIARLTPYEDTGLTPSGCVAYKKLEDEAVSKGVTFKRILELMEEERERIENKPLSPEDLQQMFGEPVWVVYLPVGNGEWEVVDEWTLAHMDEFVAYRYKLAKEGQ